MNRCWVSELIFVAVLLSSFCLSPKASAREKREKRVTVNGVTYENPVQFDNERYMSEQWMAQWPINHPWMDENEDGKISPDEWERYLDKEYELIRKALELYEPREPHKDIPYRVMMPYNYEPSKSYPLILSLHGMGGNGDDNFKSMRVWNRWLLKDEWRERFPCFMLVPQSPMGWSITGDPSFRRRRGGADRGETPSERRPERAPESGTTREGSLSVAFEIMDRFIEKHKVDKNRIYVIGHSMGGMGSLRAISERPDFFAATAFCAGRLSDAEKIKKIVNVPIWGFVGTRDRMFHGGMESLFSELKKLGGNMKLTVCKDVTHQVVYIYSDYSGDNAEKGWTTSSTGDRCETEPDVWKWLFSQNLAERKLAEGGATKVDEEAQGDARPVERRRGAGARGRGARSDTTGEQPGNQERAGQRPSGQRPGVRRGGYGAALYGAKHPELFSAAIVYDGALLNWQSLSGRHRDIRDGVFGGSETYFNAFSPNYQANINASAIKEHGTEFLLIVGRIKESNETFRDTLQANGIAYQYIDTPFGHVLTQVRGHDENAVYFLINKHFGALGPVAVNAASAAVGGGPPEFSWDTVPVYIHVGKNAGFTDEEVEFVATHSNFVCLEKGHGMLPHGSTEKGIEHDAARLKKISPKMKVLYYWNTFLDYSMYDAHRVYGSHPEWWLKTLDGSLDTKRRSLKRYDLSNPEVQEWWANEVKKAVVDGSCDGVFMDAFPQITSRANIELWGKAKYDAIQEGLISTIKLTREKVGADNILMFNGIRNTNSLHFGMNHLEFTDAAKIEHFDQFQSRDKENVVRDIEDMIEAGQKGKIVIMKGWPGFNWLDRGLRNAPYEELLARARKNITFPLACFLVAAQPHSYFCYSWGYRERHGSLSDYPEFSKPLGEPKGNAVKDGWRYSREFERCKVWVDLETKEAKIDWN